MGVGRVILYESRPLPITLTFVSVLIGGLLAWRIGYPVNWLGLFLGAIAAMLLNWADHPLDTLVDYFWRNEYRLGYKPRFGDSGILVMKGLASKGDLILGSASLYAVAVPMLAYAIALAPTWYWPALFSAIGVTLSVLYAVGGLDRLPVVGDLMFGAGVVSALLGGYFLVASSWSAPIVVLAVLLYILVFAAKIADSLPDTHDIRQGKRTIPVIIGYNRAKNLAYGLAYLFSALLILFYAIGLVPWAAVVSALAPLPLWIWAQWKLDYHTGEVLFFTGCLEAAIPLLLYLALA